MTKREQHLALIRSFRQAKKLATGRRPSKGRRIPRLVQPNAIRAEYFKQIKEAVLLPLKGISIPFLSDIVAEGDRERADSVDVIRMDSSVSRLKGILARISEQYFARVSPLQLERLAQRIGQRTSDYHREQLKKWVRASVGTDPLMAEPASIATRVEHFTAENVSLIKTVPQKFFGDLETRLVSGLRQGARAPQLAQTISERYGVAETNAARIANDQVGKFFAELNKVRQQNLGISKYVWRTMGDNRVRDEHEDLEGQEFSWDEESAEGYPGDEVNCRCWAEPVMDDFVEELGDSEND